MEKQVKNSLFSRISSRCAFFCFSTIILWFFSGLSDNATIVFAGMICGLLTPVLAIAAIIAGITALVKLTPEEKLEKLNQSGTTKNNAVAGIAGALVFLAIFVLILIISNRY